MSIATLRPLGPSRPARPAEECAVRRIPAQTALLRGGYVRRLLFTLADRDRNSRDTRARRPGEPRGSLHTVSKRGQAGPTQKREEGDGRERGGGIREGDKPLIAAAAASPRPPPFRLPPLFAAFTKALRPLFQAVRSCADPRASEKKTRFASVSQFSCVDL